MILFSLNLFLHKRSFIMKVTRTRMFVYSPTMKNVHVMHFSLAKDFHCFGRLILKMASTGKFNVRKGSLQEMSYKEVLAAIDPGLRGVIIVKVSGEIFLEEGQFFLEATEIELPPPEHH
ncbi:MAG: hypothetical protein A3C50_02530 [Candidatus Staskawiczbacteria bacterium RIFCSPHIGHO2_02_FULL_43_16]|uniref:Uncharacterized protein n=1 Tax=Candidatus Staskawiczbacteria bacterium RIFCSPHIGHO2_01_FULL_41_41 TaxID=1802203 RepID=A0A1G2HW06_9BACT|nr:MAG: hypothetical protein A2822_01555 [Candidatus Staskawiczbacteria bacterium RIFCSPHIGHO2_01_FULL_41_41]OGZ68162.1 MAG: hypothetical protein A3C50_02530 [Candidatus Staskawiczbacteria bacterium RIFCSPHIGHO2_02_FULL_43_16]